MVWKVIRKKFVIGVEDLFVINFDCMIIIVGWDVVMCEYGFFELLELFFLLELILVDFEE